MPSSFSFYLCSCCLWVCLIHSWTCWCYLLPTTSWGGKFQKSTTLYVEMFFTFIRLKLVSYHFHQVPRSYKMWFLVIVHLFSHPPDFVNLIISPFKLLISKLKTSSLFSLLYSSCPVCLVFWFLFTVPTLDSTPSLLKCRDQYCI